MDCVIKHIPTAVYPFNDMYPFYVLIETGSCSYQPDGQEQGDGGEAEQERLFQLFEVAEKEIIDGVVAQDFKQQRQMWELRENAAPAGQTMGHCIKFDVSLAP